MGTKKERYKKMKVIIVMCILFILVLGTYSGIRINKLVDENEKMEIQLYDLTKYDFGECVILSRGIWDNITKEECYFISANRNIHGTTFNRKEINPMVIWEYLAGKEVKWNCPMLIEEGQYNFNSEGYLVSPSGIKIECKRSSHKT